MKCKKCNKEMDIFHNGRAGTFVPIRTCYVCINCKIQFRTDGKGSNGNYNQYIWEKIEIK